MMTCGDGTLPYLGCKLSLISKAGIRYEGTLYTIDCEKSTLTLSKVRSFGTENRPVETRVGPREEVYDYIIFKGNNIDEIFVQEDVSLLNDPAIVQTPHHGKQNFGPPGGSSLSTYLSYGGPSMNSGTTWVSGTVPPVPTALGSKAAHNSMPVGNISDLASGGDMGHSLATRDGFKDTVPPSVGISHPIIGSGSGAPSRSSMIDQAVQAGPNDGGKKGKNALNKSAEGQRGPVRYMRGGRNARRGRAHGASANRSASFGNRLQFEEEYDFQQANEKFEELKNQFSQGLVLQSGNSDEKKDDFGNVAVGNEEPSEETQPVYYNKEVSFFDNISCEALERSKGTDWRQERKLNAETFGFSAYHRPYFRGRGGFGHFVRAGYFPGTFSYAGRTPFRGSSQCSYRHPVMQK